MKTKFLIGLVLASLISTPSYGACDFSLGITKNPDGSRTYTQECHLRVGTLVLNERVKDDQILSLNKAVDLQSLALQKADERTKLWMDTSQRMEDRTLKIEELSSKNNALYFGLGILTSIGIGFMTAKLVR